MKFKFLICLAFLPLLAGCNPQEQKGNITPIINNGDDDNGTIPNVEGMTVKGTVTNADTKKPIGGVVVSDGVNCTATDADGIYYLPSDLKTAKNVFVVTPSEYELSFGSNTLFNGYRALDSSKKVNECNFVLTPRKGSGDKYTMLFLGDPQVMSSRNHSVESWKYVTAQLATWKKGITGDLYQVMLGDMVVNEIEVSGKASNFINTLTTAGIRSMAIVGNHDHVQTADTYEDSIVEYNRYFGPYNFAVNIGNVHYIFFDSCIWANKGFTEGVTSEAKKFILNDIKYVPAGKTIMLCTHCPMTKKHGGIMPSGVSGLDTILSALKGRDVHFWYGHIHFNVNNSYTASEITSNANGLKSLESHMVGRCGGCWACSGEVGRDGSPRGIVSMTVDGSSVSWRYCSLDTNYPDDFNVLVPGQFKGENIVDDNALYCNVYIWDNKWSKPELWVDGKKAGDFTHCECAEYPAVEDPWYSHFFPIWKAQKISGFKNEPPVNYDNNHLFKITPPAGCKSCEIRIKDRWNNTLTRTVNW